MSGARFVRRTRIAAPAEDVFRWHSRPGAFERLTPPWESVRVMEHTGGIENGARVVLRMGAGPFGVHWVAEHRDYIEGRQFRDVQVEGPFARWEHTHLVEPDGAAACFLEDRIDYALPLGPLGAAAGGAIARARLARMFAYRHRITTDDIADHRRFTGGSAMRVLVTGSTGLVGSALVPFLTSGGHDAIRLVRTKPKRGEVQWDPSAGRIDPAALEDFDAVVHLAGESIASGRWTPAKKARIRDSRVEGTRILSEALAQLKRPPKVFVCASAIGYYGDRGADIVDEDSAPGAGFLADVCREWEAAAQPVLQSPTRVVHLRLGVVLSAAGGALASMLPVFRLGAGGVIGSGEQYISWVALDDVVGIIHHVLNTLALQGPVNAVAPEPVTNRDYTKTLGTILSRPTILPLPAFVARAAMGEMAQELLLSSTRVQPHRLLDSGYRFRFPQLEGALRHLLGK